MENEPNQTEELLTPEEEAPEEELPEETVPDEPREVYKPRPWWQIALAWVMLVLVVLGVISYYYWIMYRY